MESHTTAQEIAGQSRVLLLADGSRGADSGLCSDLLVTDRLSDQHVLQIAYDRTPATVVDHWQRDVGDLPASMAIICPESLADGSAALPDGVYTTSVAADDLTGVGIAVSRYLDRWDGSRAPTTACLDSLTEVLERADTERVFRFLHTVTGRFMAAGVDTHVHLDPATQDEQTIATLRTLFDTVVRENEDGWVVSDS
jgi:hypothetical protein